MCRGRDGLKHQPVGSGDRSGLAGIRFAGDSLAASE